MATIRLPADFRDFLKLLNSHHVEYLPGILTEISGCEFSECYAQKVESTLDGIPVNIIGLADLIKNKLKSGRLKDLDDARRLS